MPEPALSEQLVGLVLSLQMSAMMQLGKLLNPATGKSMRDLPAAKETIDLLGTLETKTRGNLHPEEARLLQRVLFELRMNYVEELERDKAGQAAPGPKPAESAGGAAPSGEEGAAAEGGAGPETGPRTE